MEISVIMPVYNEVDNIEPALEAAENALKKGFKNYEIIFINDGSIDGSRKKLLEAAEKNERVRVISFEKISWLGNKFYYTIIRIW